ncbi:GNAT family N-acetyltransferase [Arthrobacter sp. NPDC090010]|uniref:GNAT family N-acetyltransferase n=1 Tax=Arthrobacter sp. NPDC090010 TaxID=3363942 RepID=UPI0038036AE4
MPSEILIRPAVPADYPEIARITQDAYLAAGHFTDPEFPYLQRIRKVDERAREAEIWVAERDGAVIGSVTLAVEGEPWADIAQTGELEFRLLVVDPAIQRSGAGRALVEAILEEARRRPGISAVSLTTGETWESAHALYRAIGFERVPARDWWTPNGEAKLLVYRMDVPADAPRPSAPASL